MDLGDSASSITFICALAMVVGVLGVIIPLVPGVILCWTATVVWAIFGDVESAGRWAVVAIATFVAMLGLVAKYAWPGRNLKRSGVPNLTLLAGGALGLVGFFVIPIVGLPIGFILGVWLAEWRRMGDSKLAWPSTKSALKAAGLSMLIELSTALVIAGTWAVGLAAT
ncbi:DUF456 domain-containing protein [Virgisporangium ochraceum]|uniref:Membrane protein n=1 Tax=Virgisporangium ochraceum TaxID=65505 RepID=A0A8J3ZT63_9ACTN|nr:DUF456 domain-containing protein [Virgisporangium ochraceum]GIJ68598.1 membrane protein [Virgisporangium ochraceum]